MAGQPTSPRVWYPWPFRDLFARLDLLSQKIDRLSSLIQQEIQAMTALDDAVATLSTQVSANTDAENSAILLIQKLAALIQSNANDPQAILDLATKLKASADALGGAVVANTPAG